MAPVSGSMGSEWRILVISCIFSVFLMVKPRKTYRKSRSPGCCMLLARRRKYGGTPFRQWWPAERDSAEQQKKSPPDKPEGTISCAGKLAVAFRLICPESIRDGIGTLITFALNAIRLPRRQRAGPSAFLDKSVPKTFGTIFK